MVRTCFSKKKNILRTVHPNCTDAWFARRSGEPHCNRPVPAHLSLPVTCCQIWHTWSRRRYPSNRPSRATACCCTQEGRSAPNTESWEARARTHNDADVFFLFFFPNRFMPEATCTFFPFFFAALRILHLKVNINVIVMCGCHNVFSLCISAGRGAGEHTRPVQGGGAYHSLLSLLVSWRWTSWKGFLLKFIIAKKKKMDENFRYNVELLFNNSVSYIVYYIDLSVMDNARHTQKNNQKKHKRNPQNLF